MTRRRGEPLPVPARLPSPIVDAHTHLDACGAKDAADVAALVDKAEQAGVTRVVTVADDLAAAQWAAAAATWDPRVFAAVAVHPTRTAAFSDGDRAVLEELSREPRVVAVGETGLDYYWDYSPPAAQQEAFRWHIDLAKRVGKPLMVHDRDAHEDIYRILEEEGPPETVVFHCFSGDADFASRCVAKGYVLSFAGTVTFRNARALRDAVGHVPVYQLLVETDAPFLTPHPYRGRPNEPHGAAYTIVDIAQLRGVDLGELCAAVNANADRIFGLSGATQGDFGGHES
ncbi:MAG TPA: TatD family hydrolase [Actinophytocola sp.]|jgi:TatD DNase family protein|uniref:TatD family hydrolase n=1 Tax=Actinophytocola sp. TaxID=1872138 RepID=UPI002F9446F4